jgi:ABC-type antimicrobial peptide transport system permease subunit
VLAGLVARRSREMGVRLAMGATPASLARLVGGSLLRLVAPGLGAGTLLALALGRLLAARVYGLRPLEPLVLATVATLFAAVAALVSLGPARRAMSTDPASVLRTE